MPMHCPSHHADRARAATASHDPWEAATQWRAAAAASQLVSRRKLYLSKAELAENVFRARRQIIRERNRT